MVCPMGNREAHARIKNLNVSGPALALGGEALVLKGGGMVLVLGKNAALRSATWKKMVLYALPRVRVPNLPENKRVRM